MSKWIIAPILALLIVLVSTLVYFRNDVNGTERIHQVRRVTMQHVALGTGKVESINETTQLSFSLAGKIKTVLVSEGQQVKEGTILTEMDTTALDLEINVSKAAVAEAQARLKQVQMKALPGEISKLSERVKQAALAVDSATVRLKNLVTPEHTKPAPTWKVTEATLVVNQTVHNYNARIFELNRLKAGPTKHDLSGTAKKVELALTNYQESKEFYKAVKKKAGSRLPERDKVKLEKDIERKKQLLELAQGDHDRKKVGASKEQIQIADAQTKSAKVDLDRAKATLERLKDPPLPPKSSEWEIALAKTTLAQAESSEREAKASLDLIKADPRSENIAAAQAALNKSTSALKLAQNKKGQAVIKAPFDGIVLARLHEPASSPAPFTPIILFADMTHLRVRAELAVRYSAELKPGQVVTLGNRALFRENLSGKLIKVQDFIGPRTIFSSDPSEIKGGEVATVLIEIDKPKTEAQILSFKNALRPGLRLDVEINFERRENVLSVPRSFVTTRGGKNVVYKASSVSEGKAEGSSPVEVQLGFMDGLNVEIKSGLAEGDYLVKPKAK